MPAGPLKDTRGSPAALSSLEYALICSQYMPIRSMPAMNEPKICDNIYCGTFFQGKPCQIAKQMVMAGLKWPPDVGAQVIMANIMPKAKAHPIWKKSLKVVTPRGLVALRRKPATEAMPGNLYRSWIRLQNLAHTYLLHVEEDTSCFSHALSEPSRSYIDVSYRFGTVLIANFTFGVQSQAFAG